MILKTAQAFSGIVMVDEAYIDFSSKGSMIAYLDQCPNVIVLQTFSKAWGRAGLRLGVAYASPEIIDYYNKVKYPYNINAITQEKAIEALEKMSCVKHIYPSDANFLLIRVDDPDCLYNFLCKQGIIVRNRNRVEKCAGCLRITIGTKDENAQLINAINDYDRK